MTIAGAGASDVSSETSMTESGCDGAMGSRDAGGFYTLSGTSGQATALETGSTREGVNKMRLRGTYALITQKGAGSSRTERPRMRVRSIVLKFPVNVFSGVRVIEGGWCASLLIAGFVLHRDEAAERRRIRRVGEPARWTATTTSGGSIPRSA